MDYFVIDGEVLVECSVNTVFADIPDGVTEVASNAFADCSKLTKVNLNKVTKIRDFAFAHCVSLQDIDLKNIEHLGEGVFYQCSALSSVQFGEKLGYLPNHTFEASGLEKIVLPENIWYIGQSCFHDCVKFASVEMNGVMEIDVAAFEGCWKLYSVQFHASLLHIAPYAFSFCCELRTVTIRNTFMQIDEFVFENTVDLLIKAAQFSTASSYAKDANIRFAPIIINECFTKCSIDYIHALKNSGLFFQAKPCSESEIIIRYDKTQKEMIKEIINRR